MDWLWLGRMTLTAYLVVLSLLCVYGLHRYFLVLTFYRLRGPTEQPRGTFGALPRVTIQLPMFNERHVAERVIEAAARVEYPRELLQIQVLDDSTDETARIAAECVRKLVDRGHDIIYVHRTNRVGYKAGALEEGLKTATGEFIAIFDADFLPRPDVLQRTVHYFTDAQVGMVQCRWEHLNRNDSLLTEAEAILLDGHFLIEHTARNRSGRFMSFNGTAGIWRRSAIQDAGGWEHDTLTEDLDLSYRAQLRGWRFVFVPELTAPAELPPEMNAFKAQQHRWTKGGAQTCRKLLPKVMREAPNWRVKLEAFFHLTSWMVYVLMVLLSILVGPAMIAKLAVEPDHSFWRLGFDFLLFFVGTGSALCFYVVSQIQITQPWWVIARSLPGLMAIGIGIAVNNAIAAVEGLLRQSGEFVRTPKFGVSQTDSASSPSRRAWRARVGGLRFRGQWKAWAELGIAAYLAVCLGSFFFFDNWVERVSAAIPFLGLFIFGYAYVALQSLYGHWLAVRRAAA